MAHDHLGLEKQTMPGPVARAEKRGLVAREPSEDDGRATDVVLTGYGPRLLRELRAEAAPRSRRWWPPSTPPNSSSLATCCSACSTAAANSGQRDRQVRLAGPGRAHPGHGRCPRRGRRQPDHTGHLTRGDATPRGTCCDQTDLGQRRLAAGNDQSANRPGATVRHPACRDAMPRDSLPTNSASPLRTSSCRRIELSCLSTQRFSSGQ